MFWVVAICVGVDLVSTFAATSHGTAMERSRHKAVRRYASTYAHLPSFARCKICRCARIHLCACIHQCVNSLLGCSRITAVPALWPLRRCRTLLHVISLLCELGIAAATITGWVNTSRSQHISTSTYLFFAASLLSTLVCSAGSIAGMKRVASVLPWSDKRTPEPIVPVHGEVYTGLQSVLSSNVIGRALGLRSASDRSNAAVNDNEQDKASDSSEQSGARSATMSLDQH